MLLLGSFSLIASKACLFFRFDLVANGGSSLTLHFERAPFMTQERTVWLPWNSFYAMDTLVMKTEENSIPSCDLSGFVRPDPVIISSPLSTFFSDAPGRNPIVPETQVRTEGKIQKSVVRCYCRRKHLPQPPFVSWNCYSKKLCRAAFVLTDNKFSNEVRRRYPMFLSPRLICL